MRNGIRAAREAAGLTQVELAKRAEMSRPFLSAVENGGAIPTVTKAFSIARALGKTVDELFLA